VGAEMGIVPRDRDRPSSPPDHILGRNGEETAKTRRAQTALEIPIPKQVALLADPKPPWAQRQLSIQIASMRSVFSILDVRLLLRVRILRSDSPFLPGQYRKGDVHLLLARLVLLLGGFHRLARPERILGQSKRRRQAERPCHRPLQ